MKYLFHAMELKSAIEFLEEGGMDLEKGYIELEFTFNANENSTEIQVNEYIIDHEHFHCQERNRGLTIKAIRSFK